MHDYIIILLCSLVIFSIYFLYRSLMSQRKETDQLWNQVKVYQERLKNLNEIRKDPSLIQKDHLN